jgi:hypothetical protein
VNPLRAVFVIQRAESDFRKNGAVLVNGGRGTPFLVKFHGPRCSLWPQKTRFHEKTAVQKRQKSKSILGIDFAQGCGSEKRSLFFENLAACSGIWAAGRALRAAFL